MTWLAMQGVRRPAPRPSPSLVGIMPAIAPRPVLLVAGGGTRGIPASLHTARRAARSCVSSRTPAIRPACAAHPAEYERRTVAFSTARWVRLALPRRAQT
jgi:hypothetical protein